MDFLMALFGCANNIHNYITRRAILYYFLAIGIGFSLNCMGWEKANIFIAIYIIVCLARYAIHFIPVGATTGIGVWLGIIHEPETVNEEAGRLIRKYIYFAKL